MAKRSFINPALLIAACLATVALLAQAPARAGRAAAQPEKAAPSPDTRRFECLPQKLVAVDPAKSPSFSLAFAPEPEPGASCETAAEARPPLSLRSYLIPGSDMQATFQLCVNPGKLVFKARTSVSGAIHGARRMERSFDFSEVTDNEFTLSFSGRAGIPPSVITVDCRVIPKAAQ